MEQQNETVKRDGEGNTPAAEHHKQPKPTPAANATQKPSAGENSAGQCSAGASAGASNGASADTAQKPDAMEVLKQTPVPPALCDWLVCLRKPAISMQYNLRKRHIPDLDADGAECAPTASNACGKRANSDTMGLQGDFTIRYFDLAAGVLAMVAVGCLIKSCCYLRHKLF